MANQNQKKDEALNVGEAISQSEAFLLKNKKTIIGAIVAVVLVIAGVIAYKNLYQLPREAKAQAALFKGEQYFELNQFEQVVNGDDIGFDGVLKVIDNYGGTDAANLACAYAGISYFHLGKYEEAIKMLDKFSGNDEMVAPAIKGAMGNCYVQMDRIDKAIPLLLSAAREADNNTVSPVYLQQAGNLLLKQGKYAEALDAYQTIKDKYFQSYQAMDVDRYIQKAQIEKERN